MTAVYDGGAYGYKTIADIQADRDRQQTTVKRYRVKIWRRNVNDPIELTNLISFDVDRDDGVINRIRWTTDVTDNLNIVAIGDIAVIFKEEYEIVQTRAK